MNAEISKSDLTGMTLCVQKTVDDKAKHDVNTDENLPLIKLLNSTVKHFNGTYIHLEMSDSWIPVNTSDIASPIFVMISSIVVISNCSFHGIHQIEDREPVEHDSKKPFPFNGDYVETSAAVYKNSTIIIRDCVFENIQVDMGYDVSAALYAVHSKVDINNSIFTRNQAQWAVVYVENKTNMTVVDSVFSHNTGQQGASINVQENSSLEVHNSTFTHNSATFGSGILALDQTSVYVRDSVFSHNTGDRGASINVQRNSSLEVHNSSFTHNNATYGSGICAGFQGFLYITGSVFTDNRAYLGAALFVATTSAANITSSVFHHNTAHQGGALNVQQNSSVSIAHSVFTENSADTGGAITVTTNVNMHINTSTFNGNSAQYGGVLDTQRDVNVSLSDSMLNNNRANETGGVITATVNTNIVLSRADLSDNTAKKGAALFILNSSFIIEGICFSDHSFNVIYMRSSIVVMETSIFINNFLTDSVIVEADEKSNILFTIATFVNNEAQGMIKSSMTPVTLNFCHFSDNIATRYDLINSIKALLVINQSLIHNNSIHGGSGIVHDDAIITSCTFSYNTVEHDYELIQGLSGRLQLTESNFMYNQGDVVYRTSDVVLNACNFTGNNPQHGTLSIWNNGATLRTSDTTIIAPAHGNKVAVYFIKTTKQISMTDYMTYDTFLISGNTTLNSSSTDTFLQEAVASGLVVIDRQGFPYTVTQEETVFASGNPCCTNTLICRVYLH